MQELYENVLELAKKSVKDGAPAKDIESLVRTAISLHYCVNSSGLLGYGLSAFNGNVPEQ